MALLPLFLASAMLLPSALAGKEYPNAKTFKFKDDFFVKFDPLATAIGPNESVDRLMSALDDFAEQFRDTWVAEIEANLQGGGGACEVDRMDVPTFSMCEWKYPDRYDVDELPTPGQCYEHEAGFVQRIYYRIEKLEITCKDDFSYEDLDKDAYVAAAFANQAFLNVVNPPNTECDGDETTTCLFADATIAERNEGYDDCTAELYINRFVDVPVYLKCLDQGYGPRRANKIIKALDKFFELVVTAALEEEIMSDAPTGFVYNFASPYASDREFCAHGSYYTGGNLVNQQPDSDGIYVTKFTYGFDVIWYKPKEFDGEELLPDVDQTVKNAFEDGAFLTFLREEYPDDYDFIQDDELCDVIDPADAAITFSPTDEPTPSPTEAVCDLDTNDGCDEGQVCRLSCAYASNESQCFDDEIERDCAEKWGPGWVCKDSNKDGTIDGADHSDGCQFLQPTQAPSSAPTLSPIKAIVVTTEPTVSPTLRPTSLEPTISQSPSDFIEPSAAPSLTSIPSSAPPTLVPTSRTPTLTPTAASTPGATDTLGTQDTLSPTPLLTRPVETLPPTTSPESLPTTPSPTCPNCIVHPDDTQPDECPIVTTGTCGGGDRGDGICPFAGHCCSEWGWCGTTSEYCDDDSVAPTPSAVEGAPAAPTYSQDAGQCASGDVGDGFCPDESLCCSEWGYCGSGENYCFTTRIYDDETGEASDSEGTCGGGGVGDGTCLDGLCCSQFGFCGEGELYCTGNNAVSDSSAQEGQDILDRSPLPDALQPEFGFRCGFSEVDARSNCKPECTHHIQCSEGEECWGVQLNYCNTFEEGTHPVCLDLELADEDSRCGLDEASARGHCGPKCASDAECGVGEFCFPTLLNLCECHEEGPCPEESAVAFASAKALISPYFVETDPMNDVEGKPRSAALKLDLGLATTSALVLVASMGALLI